MTGNPMARRNVLWIGNSNPGSENNNIMYQVLQLRALDLDGNYYGPNGRTLTDYSDQT